MVELDRIKELAKEKRRSFVFLSNSLGQNDGYLKDKRLHNSPLNEEQLKILADILDTTTDYLHGKTDIKEKPDVSAGLSDIQKAMIDWVMAASDEDLKPLYDFLQSRTKQAADSQ